MTENDLINSCYKKCYGTDALHVNPLPRSGSDRRYFRVTGSKGTVICALNANREENDAFVGFTRHFFSKDLPVPEVYFYFPEKDLYFLKDLGDVNLYTWLHSGRDMEHFSGESITLYKKILDRLILFQAEGIKGLDLNLCYPHKSFDRQSMMWDMNYFKYMLLKLLAVPFNERSLENDFNTLSDYLLQTGQDYFLYRDFQTANIMIVEAEPWFIDYQGGRKGAPQYDVASLLYDAKIPMSQEDRELLLDYYIDKFCSLTGTSVDSFRGYYEGFAMIRVMQALGAFGFRGLYEQKPTFTESIVPGVRLINNIITRAENHVPLKELYRTIRGIPETVMFRRLESSAKQSHK